VNDSFLLSELGAEIVAFGMLPMVTAALPEEVPVQFASWSEVIVYDVSDDGETVRVSVVELVVRLCPSDHVPTNGGTPVSVATTCAVPPGQIVPPPETVAVGFAFTVTVMEVELYVQPVASFAWAAYAPLAVAEYVVPVAPVMSAPFCNQLTVQVVQLSTDAFSWTEPPAQNVVGPEAVTDTEAVVGQPVGGRAMPCVTTASPESWSMFES
jgi:hypothetical protein